MTLLQNSKGGARVRNRLHRQTLPAAPAHARPHHSGHVSEEQPATDRVTGRHQQHPHTGKGTI